MSGDLKDPAKAIPQGTFLAIIVTYITYMCYGLMIGSVYLSNASGSVAAQRALPIAVTVG